MKRLLFIILICTFFLCSDALAQGFLDSVQFSRPAQAGSTATISIGAGRSVTCFVEDDGSYALSATVTGPSGEEIVGIRPAFNSLAAQQFFGDAIEFGDTSLNNNIISFVTTLGAAGFGNYTFTLSSVAEGSDTPRIICQETSLACSFNTSVNDFNFLEVTNTGTEVAVVKYIATDFNGVSTEATGFVEPGSRADFNVHSVVGPARFGSIIVLPLIAQQLGEQVTARLSQYKGSDLSNTEVCEFLPSVAQQRDNVVN